MTTTQTITPAVARLALRPDLQHLALWQLATLVKETSR